MHELILSVATVPDLHGFWNTLIRSSEPGILQHVAYYLPLKCICEVSRLVNQPTASVLVACDCGKMPIGIIEGCDYLRRVRYEEFLPHRAFVLLPNAIRVRLQLLGFGQVCEFLIVKSSYIAQRAGSHYRTNPRVLISEATFECHHDMATILYIVGDLSHR